MPKASLVDHKTFSHLNKMVLKPIKRKPKSTKVKASAEPSASTTTPRVVPWNKKALPSEQEAEALLHQQGYEPFCWNDFANASYPPHRHEHDECIFVLWGQMLFEIDGQRFQLNPGDRLYLPRHTLHSAIVSAEQPVTYLVGQKRK